MILEPKSTTVAYRCPKCGSGVMSAVGMFNLSADRVRLRCSNPECPTNKERGEERDANSNDALDVIMSRDGDGTVRLTVPCIFCGKPHRFTVNPKLFFGKDVFVLPCPYSGINICFMGEGNHVKAELARSELELLDMLEENGIDGFRDLDADEAALPDPQIYEIIMFVIHDLDAEGKIFCRCHPEGGEDLPEGCLEAETGESAYEGDYTVDITEKGLLVRCAKCGAQKLIETDSLIGAHDFLNCDSLHLE